MDEIIVNYEKIKTCKFNINLIEYSTNLNFLEIYIIMNELLNVSSKSEYYIICPMSLGFIIYVLARSFYFKCKLDDFLLIDEKMKIIEDSLQIIQLSMLISHFVFMVIFYKYHSYSTILNYDLNFYIFCLKYYIPFFVSFIYHFLIKYSKFSKWIQLILVFYSGLSVYVICRILIANPYILTSAQILSNFLMYLYFRNLLKTINLMKNENYFMITCYIIIILAFFVPTISTCIYHYNNIPKCLQ